MELAEMPLRLTTSCTTDKVGVCLFAGVFTACHSFLRCPVCNSCGSGAPAILFWSSES